MSTHKIKIKAVKAGYAELSVTAKSGTLSKTSQAIVLKAVKNSSSEEQETATTEDESGISDDTSSTSESSSSDDTSTSKGTKKTQTTNIEVLEPEKKPNTSTEVNVDFLSDDFANQFDANNDDGSAMSKPITDLIVTIVNHILVILQILGAVILVLSIAIFGINSVLSADKGVAKTLGLYLTLDKNDYGKDISSTISKSDLLDSMRSAIIGSFILFMSSTIVKIVFGIFMNI